MSTPQTPSIDKWLLLSTFHEIFSTVSNDANQLLSVSHLETRQLSSTLTSLEMFITLCNEWGTRSRSRQLDNNDKIIVREKRRLARALYTDI